MPDQFYPAEPLPSRPPSSVPQAVLTGEPRPRTAGALFFGGPIWVRTGKARTNYWPPILQTSSTFGNEPLKSVKSNTVMVEMEVPLRAPVGESVVVAGLELTGFITGAEKVGAFEVDVVDVRPVVPLD
jgi:hypothetical protein